MMCRTGRPLLVIAAGVMASAVVSGTTAPAGAQETEVGVEERLAEFQQRLDSARARLQLGDEQVEQLLPILRENFEGTMAILEEHGIDIWGFAEGRSNRRLNLRQLRSLGRDLDAVREAMFEKIEELGFLSQEQFTEFKEIQEEQRQVLRERLRAGR